jgi:hypothetical protein
MTTSTVESEVPRVEGERSRTTTWTDPARVRFRLRGHDGFERLPAMKRGDASSAVCDDAATLYAHAKSTCPVIKGAR